MKFFPLLLLSLLPAHAWAFPEMVVHGYVNCNACHVSPSGGGLLNGYGRELSKELLSTWAKEGEQNFAWGALTLPEQVLVSGYVRGLQFYQNTPAETLAKVILMQADLEAALDLGRVVVDGTFGIESYTNSAGHPDHRFYSRRHFAMARVGDQQNLRFGRFQNNYGINDPNHELFVRNDLGFGNDTESYALEYSYLGENFSAYLSAIFGNFHDPYAANQEKGLSATGSYFFWDHNKLGTSYYYGETKEATRNLVGPWAIVAWSEKLYSESEFDYQYKKTKAPSTHQSGYVTTNKLAYTVHKGVNPFLAWEFSRLNLNTANSEKQSFGAGLQFLPRPHFEFIAEWQKIRLYSAGKYYSDYAWISANFYL